MTCFINKNIVEYKTERVRIKYDSPKQGAAKSCALYVLRIIRSDPEPVGIKMIEAKRSIETVGV